MDQNYRNMRTSQPPKTPCTMEEATDRISNLPGHIIDRIMLNLSIREAVRMSILSSKWRYKWASLPHLIFDKDCCPSSSEAQVGGGIKSKLVSIIDHVLILHTGIIHKFKLSHKDLQGVPDIDRWILRISRSNIQEFILEIWKGQRYRIPSCLYLSKHLIHLELFNCLLSPPPSFKGFLNLKSLDLQHITLSQDSFENLIANCPLLERLTLMNFDGFSRLRIRAPNLRFFDIGGVYEEVSFENTSLLSIISIGLYVTVRHEVSAMQTSNLVKFFIHLPHIQRLEVQGYFLKLLALGSVPGKLPVACLDLNYLSMRINFNDIKEWKAALCLLRSSPNLIELEMLARPEEDSIVRPGLSFWAEGNQSECPFDQLRVVRIVDIIGIRPELDFMKFLLANSPMLEKLTVKPASTDGGLELLKELIRYRRASVQAEVVYVDP